MNQRFRQFVIFGVFSLTALVMIGAACLDTEPGGLPTPTPTPIPSDVARLRGYVVQWLLDNCADNRPGEEANFRHYQLAGFTNFVIRKTGDASWTFTSGSETWTITELPIMQVNNPHGNSWCLK